MEYPSNSNAGRNNPPSGNMIETKQPNKGLLGSFFSGDPTLVGKYVYDRSIKPQIKELAFNAFLDAVAYIFWGDQAGMHKGGLRRMANMFTNYNYMNYSQNTISTPMQQTTQRPTNSVSYSRPPVKDWREISFASYEEAQNKIFLMAQDIQLYGRLSIKSFFEHSERTVVGDTWPLENWGWRSIEGFQPYSAGGAWYISAPDPVTII